MRLVILGAGAIGGVVAGHLARANREVLAIARGAHLAAIRAHGLRVETPSGTFVTHPEAVEAAAVTWRDGDVLVVAVKTQDLAGALREVAVPAHVPIVCMTNGVEAERLALRHVREVYGCCVLMPATYLVPGTVQVWAGPVPGLLELGHYPDGTGELGDAIAGELIVAGFATEVRANIMKWKRGKLLANLMNGAEAISGPAARTSELATRAKAEGRACYAAANLSCITEAEDAERRTALTSQPIAGATRSGGSTWQSLARGAGTLETDYLNGEIAMLGRLHGVATPVNEALQRLAAEAARAGLAPGALPLAELIAKVDDRR
ncbi:MAG: 2-dehydropantoate 2-reductase N-terminal domain-containing protein [Kofleriaceae bacterium]